MPVITWTPAMSVGVEALDTDHKMLFGLINQLAKISEYETDHEHPTGAGDDFAAIAADAERYRRELAERLARLVPPLE